MRRIVGLVPVGVEGELHPEPPDRGEQHGEPGQGAQRRVVLERPGELADRSGEYQVEEQLEPAGGPLFPLVAAGGPQWRCAEPRRGQRDAGEQEEP